MYQRVVLHFFTLSPETITTNTSKDRHEGGEKKLFLFFLIGLSNSIEILFPRIFRQPSIK